ncbi:hypothetical protein B0H17DRAFT_1216330 [Mycena rosella]|uniref:Uncharacterized protein n=1 Tax=Mycena rosella TaxID=1033263 RepID=A0AAD7C9W7_MYCRO|nr:hypothetical protein B0H17DRAFT_1216330 [Mycena rosella]
MFDDTPLLRTVHLVNLHSQLVTLPWAQLTPLVIEKISMGELLTVLFTPCHQPRESSPPFAPPIDFVEETIVDALRILPFLTIPRLRDLKLALSRGISRITPMSAHALDWLYLYLQECDVPRFLEYISSLPPSLRTAKIAISSGCAAVLSPLLARLNDDPALLPGLGSLAITVLASCLAPHAPVVPRLLSDMLRTQWAMRLRTFELVSWCPLPSVDAEMAELVADGLKIRMEMQSDPHDDFGGAEF